MRLTRAPAPRFASPVSIPSGRLSGTAPNGSRQVEVSSSAGKLLEPRGPRNINAFAAPVNRAVCPRRSRYLAGMGARQNRASKSCRHQILGSSSRRTRRTNPGTRSPVVSGSTARLRTFIARVSKRRSAGVVPRIWFRGRSPWGRPRNLKIIASSRRTWIGRQEIDPGHKTAPLLSRYEQ